MSKIVLITGASSGIGKAIGNYLHQQGYRVLGTSRNPDKYRDQVPFDLLQLDVTQAASISALAVRVKKEYGRLDVLVNNAGVGITGPLEETPNEEVRKAFETNLFGPLQLIQDMLPIMRPQKSGLIINITSIAGYMGLPYRGIYSASKGALEIITEAYRMELRQFGIHMTSVAPGDFATNIAAGRYHAPVLSGSPYEKEYGETLEMMNEHVDHGSDPNQMAKAVANIIDSSKPKVHYRVGAFLQKFSIILKRILPDTWYERMLMNHYKLK